jgi:hypothetical protein
MRVSLLYHVPSWNAAIPTYNKNVLINLAPCNEISTSLSWDCFIRWDKKFWGGKFAFFPHIVQQYCASWTVLTTENCVHWFSRLHYLSSLYCKVWDSALKPWKERGKCDVGGGNEKKMYLILFRTKIFTTLDFTLCEIHVDFLEFVKYYQAGI